MTLHPVSVMTRFFHRSMWQLVTQLCAAVKPRDSLRTPVSPSWHSSLSAHSSCDSWWPYSVLLSSHAARWELQFLHPDTPHSQLIHQLRWVRQLRFSYLQDKCRQRYSLLERRRFTRQDETRRPTLERNTVSPDEQSTADKLVWKVSITKIISTILILKLAIDPRNFKPVGTTGNDV